MEILETVFKFFHQSDIRQYILLLQNFPKFRLEMFGNPIPLMVHHRFIQNNCFSKW